MLLERGHRLRPAETHPAERLHRLHVVLHRRRRVLDDLLLRKRRHRGRIVVLFLASKRQTDLHICQSSQNAATAVKTLTLSLLCRVAAAFSLVESPVDGRGLGDAWRGGGDAWRGVGEETRGAEGDSERLPGCVELDPRGEDATDDVGNGVGPALLGGGPGGGW